MTPDDAPDDVRDADEPYEADDVDPDPVVKPRPRKRPSPFDAFEDIFDKMNVDPSEFDKMFRDLHKSVMDAMRSGTGMPPGKPFVTGFSFRMGPDGRPHIENFGNRPARRPGEMPRISDEREPLTDLVEDGKHIAVTMEIPGVEKTDIQLEAKADSLEISVDTEARKYHKIVRLPGKVKPESTKATYKNGILDVILERAESAGGVPVSIE